MSAIGRAIADVKFRIPPRILDLIFIKRNQRLRQTSMSLDDHILNEVIRPRVLIDCNQVGGTEVFLLLDGLEADRPNDYTSVYRIPKERTGGRSINSVLNITFADPTRLSSYGVAAGCQNTPMLQATQAVMDAMGAIPLTSTAYCQLINENTVMVRDTIILPANSYLRCILSHDENLSHLQIRSYTEFTKLCEYAVKAYIYNQSIIDMDVGELQGGHNLGIIKTIIEGYADAEELYQRYLQEVIQKVMYMNDTETWKRHMKLLIGGNR